MDLSIIIVNYNVYEDVKKCIESIFRHLNNLAYEIIVVDNNSPDRAILDINKEFDGIRLIPLDKNYGFAYANNKALKVAKGNYLFLVNPDIIFEDNSIQSLHEFMESNLKAGTCAPVQFKPGSGIEYYYTFFPSIYSRLMQENRLYMTAGLMKERFFDFLNENIAKGEPFQVNWAIGSCLMIRNQVYKDLGGFDEAFFLFEEETEWQYRMNKKGWYTYIVPETKVLHNHHSSASKLGKIFVYYHEFRSRIIFDRKRFSGISYFIRVSLIDIELILRVIYFSLRSVTNRKMLVKLKAYFDLLKFNLNTRQEVINSRYDFEKKKMLFT